MSVIIKKICEFDGIFRLIFNLFRLPADTRLAADKLGDSLIPKQKADSIGFHLHLLLAAQLVFWLCFPLAAIFPIMAFLALFPVPKLPKHLCLLMVCGSLGLLNFTKEPIYDLEGYYLIFSWLGERSIWEFNQIYKIDPAFFLTTSLLSHLVGGYPPIFLLFWTVVMYYVLFLSIIELSKLLDVASSWVAGIVFFTIFVGYAFMLTSHLTRQFVAMAVFCLAFTRALGGRRDSYALFALAALTHHSVVLMLPSIVFTREFKATSKRFLVVSGAIAFVAILIGMFNFFDYVHLIPRTSIPLIDYRLTVLANYVFEPSERDWFFYRMLAQFVGLSLLVAAVALAKPQYRDVGLKIALLFVILLGYLIVFRNTGFFLDRYFFYRFGLATIALPLLVKQLDTLFPSIMLILIGASPLLFLRTLANTEWRFVDNSPAVLIMSVLDFINGTPM